MEFLSTNDKLSPYQHGFRSGHSPQTQLLESVHEWAKCLDNGASSHVVFTDFSKAFDTVRHQCLLLKLEHIGISGNLLKWFDHFLTNRRQRVVIDGYSSHWLTVTSGVPQGTILGPLLFLIYVDDIGNGLSSTVRLFADDCTLYREVRSLQDCTLLQQDINKLHSWTQKWQLALNTNKCKVMNISLKKKALPFTYCINNNPLEWVDVIKCLGVKIHRKLSWADHVTEITSRASQILNLLRRSMHGCHKDAKSIAYTALVRPHLEYSSPVWTPHHQKLIDSIEKIQKRAARWICGTKWNNTDYCWSTPYANLCSDLQWTTLERRRSIASCCQVYKIIHSMGCITFDKYFTWKKIPSRIHPYVLSIPTSRINVYRSSFFISVQHLWNKLPTDVVDTLNFHSFKFKLTHFYLSASI